MSEINDSIAVEYRKLRLEEARLRYDIVKWTIAVVGAIVSFYVVDLGKLGGGPFGANPD